jgi:predicted glycosyltransferase
MVPGEVFHEENPATENELERTYSLGWLDNPSFADQPDKSRPRIALYSPGMVGLGHIRRNLLIAHAITKSGLRPVVLIIAEAREAGVFAMPDGVDCLTLPALRKDVDGQCSPRYLDISLAELIDLRKRVINAALQIFQPDVFIADHLPRGAFQELDESLKQLRAKGTTHCILGMRDVLGDPLAVKQQWEEARNHDVVARFYDSIWIYGDPRVYDAVREQKLFHDVKEKVVHTGYLDQRTRLGSLIYENRDLIASLDLLPGRLALCLVGGGQDGARLAEAFANATLPPDTNGVILTGPFMSAELQQKLMNLAANKPRLKVVNFLSEPTQLLEHADYVVSMGGYNTVCEILSFEKKALIVPRVRRAPEQMIRAERLEALGLISVIHPELATSDAITSWFLSDPPRPVKDKIHFNGLENVMRKLEEILSAQFTCCSERRTR